MMMMRMFRIYFQYCYHVGITLPCMRTLFLSSLLLFPLKKSEQDVEMMMMYCV